MDETPIFFHKQSTVSSMVPKSKIRNDLNKWIFERIKPFITGRILEIVDDNLASFCLQINIKPDSLILDLTNEAFKIKHVDILETYDTLIDFNCTNQICKNEQLTHNCSKFLKPGGHVITFLPAHTALYNGLEQGLQEWIDENQMFINNLLRVYYKIVKVRYFILKEANEYVATESEQSFSQQLNQLHKDLPIFLMENKTSFQKIGLFIIVVGRKR